MQDIHDEKRIPLDPEPESQSFLESIRFWVTFGALRRNKRDRRQQRAADLNAIWHEAEDDRARRQPGAAIVRAGAHMLGRVGRGDGFADLILLPALALGCVAILRALAVLL